MHVIVVNAIKKINQMFSSFGMIIICQARLLCNAHVAVHVDIFHGLFAEQHIMLNNLVTKYKFLYMCMSSIFYFTIT